MPSNLSSEEKNIGLKTLPLVYRHKRGQFSIKFHPLE